MDWIVVGFGKALTGWSWWLRVLEVGLVPLVVAALGYYGIRRAAQIQQEGMQRVARMQQEAEVMKLRQAIAERRVKEFDDAVSSLRRAVVGMGQRDVRLAAEGAREFCSQHPAALMNVSTAIQLALLPEHAAVVQPIEDGLRSACRDLFDCLTHEQRSSEPVVRRGIRSAAEILVAIEFLMVAVDISAEARLGDTPSRDHTARVEVLVQSFEQQVKEASARSDPGSSDSPPTASAT